jgi:hypothetical protein
MLDDLHHSEGPVDGPKRLRGDAERPLADREVPLGRVEGTLAMAVHSWLDGDLPEAAVRKGDTARDVDFWKRLNGDIARRRQVQTPNGLELRIMAAIPQTVPQLITPWWRREMVVTPADAVLAAVALATVAVTATVVLLAR